MRKLYAVAALTLMMGCAGSDGKDGQDGVPGPRGDEGPPGKSGQDGDEGAPGRDGVNGTNGVDGMDGMDGTPGEDGATILQGSGPPAAATGADGDIYIDTESRDVYQKGNGVWTVITNLSGGPAGPKGDPGEPGEPGENGTNGSSVRTGSGAPGAGLGNVGDVYIDADTGDMYSKGAGGWAMVGSLQGPPGEDGVDVEDTLMGMRWFAFALTAGFADAPQLINSETYTDTSSSATFSFTGAGQSGRIASQLTGSYLPGGANLSAFETLTLSVSVGGGSVGTLALYLADGSNRGCQWTLVPAAGPDYEIDLSAPDLNGCYSDDNGEPFSLASVTMLQVGIVSSGNNTRSLTITDLNLVDSE